MSQFKPKGDSIPPSNFSIYPSSQFSRAKLRPSLNLSAREVDICHLLAEGYNTREIADILNLSEHTVSTHRKKIIQKTDCRNTTHLVAECLKQGLLRAGE